MKPVEHFKRVVERLREMERGKLNLSPETLRELDSFFLEQILSTPELNERERGEVLELYLKTANSSVLLRTA